MNTLIFSAIFEGLRTRKDKTNAITLGTQEMSPEGAANLLKYNQTFIQVMIKEGEITQDDIRDMENFEFDEFDKRQDKSPSQRLRNVFWLLWNQDNKGYNEFKDYYNDKIEKVIEHFKAKIL